MRILLTHNSYSVQGGAEVFAHEVARVLEANGHDVALFTAAEDGLDVPNSDLFPIAADYSGSGLFARAAQLPKAIYNRDAKAAFARMIERFQPDVIHAFAVYVRLTPSILEAAREAGVPVVLSCNDYKHICPNYKLYHHGHICTDCKGGRFYKALVNRCAHGSFAISAASMAEAYVHEWRNIWRGNVAKFLFASHFMAEQTEAFWGKGTVDIDFLRNPFDATKNFVVPNVGDYMLYFGRLIDEKGVDVLLDAAELAPEVPVVVVGDGPDRAKLEKRAQALDNVRLVGPTWGEDLHEWLKNARAVVVPSIWHENFPYVILQAFAASTPVIASNRGGMPELVLAQGTKTAFGWTYDATDAAALAERMRTVLDQPGSELSEIGAAAYEYVSREFSDASIYSRLMAIYDEVMK